MIKKLNDGTSSYLKSQQYILNTYTIVKELLENSLDAKANVIKINIDEVEIRIDDNGSGISDLTNIGEDGYTSKEYTSYFVVGYNNDKSVLSFGYRGRALSSIKNMCDIEITTSTSNEGVALKKVFSDNGCIVKSVRERGTTVKVTNIFKDCDIRKKINKKNILKDVKKIKELLEAYSCIYKVSFAFKYKGKLIFNMTGFDNLDEYCKSKHADCYESCLRIDGKDYFLFMLPFALSSELSKMFYEKRFVSSKKLSSTIRNTFNLYAEGNPLFYLQLRCKVDFNISTDKTEILLEDENVIVSKIREDINRYFSDQIFVKNKVEGERDTRYQTLLDNHIKDINKEKVEENTLDENLSLISSLKENINDNLSLQMERKEEEKFENICELNENKKDCSSTGLPESLNSFVEEIKSEPIREISFRSYLSQKLRSQSEKGTNVKCHVEKKSSENSNVYLKSPVSEKFFEKEGELELIDTAFTFIKRSKYKNVNFHLSKHDFLDVKILGQFNKGFIITSLRKINEEYIIIIDQHAADEIKTYEMLRNHTKIERQKLVVPLKLNMSSLDEILVYENIPFFLENGFEIEDGYTKTVPVYRNNVFGIEEFRNLLENFKNDIKGFDRIHNILASKACRSSIMIGESLTKPQMENIVRNLASLKKPWKCPHGRPTFYILKDNTV